MELWSKYEVRLQFVGKLCGSTPLNPEIIQGWLEARKPSVRPANSKSMDDIHQEVLSTLATEDIQTENEEIEKRVTLGFQNVNGGLVMRGGTMKAHLKDCARILSSMIYGKVKGERSFAVKLLNCLNVEEYWIPVLKEGQPVLEADDYLDKAVHVQTMMGPRNALKRILFVNRPTMNFHLLITNTKDGKPVVSMDDLETVFKFGAVKGYGGERGDGEGRYAFKIQDIKKGDKNGNTERA